MREQNQLTDLVVVLPGITGSVLAVGGHDVWALSGRAIMRGVVSLGRSVDALMLPAGFGTTLPVDEGDGEPGDAVTAPRLIPDLHVVPGLWSPIKGYTELVDMFRRRFGADSSTGNFLEFPYDWRLSNVVNARRLRDVAIPALERWRVRHPEAKLVLVCHSMGGLVARWFLEVLGGAEVTRWLITAGTPYQGAVNSLESLVNGLAAGLGPLKKDLTALVRTFPSIYELLPTYPCIGDGDGGALQTLAQQSCGLDTAMIAAARTFHETLQTRIAARGPAPYEILAIKGIDQPTSQSARWMEGGVEPLRFIGGRDRSGDGTVPRPSAHPPEWQHERAGSVVFASQRHGFVQESDAVLSQVYAVLTARDGGWLGGEPLGIEVPTLSTVGEALPVLVTSPDDSLALTARVTRHDSDETVDECDLLTNLGDGRYECRFPALEAGTYQVTVASAVAGRNVDPVSDIAIVWMPEVDA